MSGIWEKFVGGFCKIWKSLVDNKAFYPFIALAILGFMWLSAVAFVICFSLLIGFMMLDYYSGFSRRLASIARFIMDREWLIYSLIFLPYLFFLFKIIVWITLPFFLVAVIVAMGSIIYEVEMLGDDNQEVFSENVAIKYDNENGCVE